MRTTRPSTVIATAPKYSRRKKAAKPLTGPIVKARSAIPPTPVPAPAPVAPRIVQAMSPKRAALPLACRK
jgi:hypothetical protein